MTTGPSDSGHYAADAVEAALALGQMLLDSRDFPAALESFQMAARAGSATAITMLGRIHERGWGMARDPAMAARYYRRAAGLGDPWAMFNLADLYLGGTGLAQDDAEAHRLYAAAAAKGHVKALNMLGMLAEAGRGPDAPDTAEAYFHAAADAGDPWAQFNLSRRLLRLDRLDEALAWLDRSLTDGFGDYWRAMAENLHAHPDPHLRDRAAKASALARG